LKSTETREKFRERLEKQLEDGNIDEKLEVDEIWKRLKEGMETVAEEICGNEKLPWKQNWMNADILRKMEERRKCKIGKNEEQYRKLKKEIQKLCREIQKLCGPRGCHFI